MTDPSQPYEGAEPVEGAEPAEPMEPVTDPEDDFHRVTDNREVDPR